MRTIYNLANETACHGWNSLILAPKGANIQRVFKIMQRKNPAVKKRRGPYRRYKYAGDIYVTLSKVENQQRTFIL